MVPRSSTVTRQEKTCAAAPGSVGSSLQPSTPRVQKWETAPQPNAATSTRSPSGRSVKEAFAAQGAGVATSVIAVVVTSYRWATSCSLRSTSSASPSAPVDPRVKSVGPTRRHAPSSQRSVVRKPPPRITQK
jgi:hypothetical protein